MGWYVLFVQAGQEDLVRTMIYKFFVRGSIHAIVPKRKIIERRQGKNYEICKTMFPGYVFVNTKMNVKTYYKLKKIPRYYRLLNKYQNTNERDKKLCGLDMGNVQEDDFELFSKIEDEEMDQVLQLIGKDEVIDFSFFYVEDGRVTVHDGPLKGNEGIIKKIDKRKKRARIVLQIMGNEKMIDIGIEMLTPSDNGNC
ncbi:antiterminator LoaP [Brevibacillus laterosporus]|uniref:Transcription antiterminator n=1 Tax=Brevibacillus laterosporus TaxID=1465 RepID=A0A0F7C1R4_BRELA|nr:antiterminator LoaP [Brevibacillus laterosporus]AKF95944.1 transcription antiterminator [Brevibacillus laterosporus]